MSEPLQTMPETRPVTLGTSPFARMKQLESAVDETALVASIPFVLMAQAEQIDDGTIAEHARFFPVWDEHWRGKARDIVRDADDGNLYRSIHDVTNAGQNTKPSLTPSMWTRIGDPGEEWPEWVQPIGSHDAYEMGDKVSYAGEHWISDVSGNVWMPGTYGWSQTQA